MGDIVDALVKALPERALRVDAPVDAIERRPDGWQLFANGAGFRVPVVVLAAPAHVAARLLAPIDAPAAQLCARVPYVSTASVALAWPRHLIAHPLDGTGFVVARRHATVRITAATWVSAKWEARAPEDSSLIRVFLGGEHDPRAVDLSDEEMIDVVRADLAATMGIVASPTLARVFRWRNAGAQHTVGHLQRVDEIDQRLRAHGSLYVGGAGFRSVGIPDCVADARRIAAAITGTG
jgi:oxygen-dependent protoporphyrinogen oxidase